ncbi:MAG: fibronectin type III domain-containing protein [Parachlamydia sp.]|nr:fibronectin type III domain-containing protein [Parachlamydia sp.]
MFHRALPVFLLWTAFVFGEYDPVALYLTWQRQPDTTMTIQWISDKDRHEDLVEYQRPGESLWNSATGSHAPMPEKYPFLIHRLELTQLLPDTDYRFRIGSDGVIYKFRTMPSTMATPIRFIVGGDMYRDGWDLLEKMNKQAARLEPMFVLAGGDLAYNEKGPKVHKHMPRWLEWLIAWKKQMVTSQGRLIPIVPAIGNHDVKKHHPHEPESAPFFYALFPYPGYSTLDFGTYLSLFLLDSGHTHPIDGAQTDWLEKALQIRQNIPHKIALYHVPAYPSVRDFNNSASVEIRKFWVPLFEKHFINAAFENHDHAYKRTWPIRNGKKDPSGVLYLGDGGWAVAKPRPPRNPSKTWYLANAKASRNIVLVILHGQHRHFIAYDDDGNIIDETVSGQH